MLAADTSMRSILPSSVVSRWPLPIVPWLSLRAAAVADADVEETVRAERDVAAVVVGRRIVDVEQHQFGRGGSVCAAVGAAELRDAIDQSERRSVRGIEEIDARIRRVVRMEGHAQQAALVVRAVRIERHQARDVDELARRRHVRACCRTRARCRSSARRTSGRCASAPATSRWARRMSGSGTRARPRAETANAARRPRGRSRSRDARRDRPRLPAVVVAFDRGGGRRHVGRSTAVSNATTV